MESVLSRSVEVWFGGGRRRRRVVVLLKSVFCTWIIAVPFDAHLLCLSRFWAGGQDRKNIVVERSEVSEKSNS